MLEKGTLPIGAADQNESVQRPDPVAQEKNAEEEAEVQGDDGGSCGSCSSVTSSCSG